MRRMQQPEFQYLHIPTCGCPVPKSQNTPLKGKSKESVVFLFISLFYSVCLTHHKAWLKPNYYSKFKNENAEKRRKGKTLSVIMPFRSTPENIQTRQLNKIPLLSS